MFLTEVQRAQMNANDPEHLHDVIKKLLPSCYAVVGKGTRCRACGKYAGEHDEGCPVKEAIDTLYAAEVR